MSCFGLLALSLQRAAQNCGKAACILGRPALKTAFRRLAVQLFCSVPSCKKMLPAACSLWTLLLDFSPSCPSVASGPCHSLVCLVTCSVQLGARRTAVKTHRAGRDKGPNRRVIFIHSTLGREIAPNKKRSNITGKKGASIETTFLGGSRRPATGPRRELLTFLVFLCFGRSEKP